MQHQIQLGILRNTEDQRQGLPPDSPLTFELHARRGKAVHDIFDDDPNFTVADWGNTDSEEPHEFISITLVVAAKFAFQQAVLPGLGWLGKKLAEKLVEDQIIKAVEDAFAKVWPRMKTGDIQEASVSVSPANAAPADNHIHIYVYNSPPGGMIKINAPSGSESFDNFEGVPRL